MMAIISTPNNRKFVLAAGFMGMLLFGIVMISLGSIIPDLTGKFDLSELESGRLLSFLPLGILIGSILFGPFVDWIGYKKILFFGTILTISGIEGIAYSSLFSTLQLAVIIIGIGGGFLNGATNALVADISEKNHSANLSLLGVFFGIGALGTPLVLAILKDAYNFEKILIWLGMILLLPLLYFMLIKFPNPKYKSGLPIAKGVELLREPLLLIAGLVLFLQSALEGIVNNWTTTFLQNTNGFSSENALFALSIFVIGLTIARLILGKLLILSDPLGILRKSLVIAIAGVAVLYWNPAQYVTLLAVMLVGIGLAAGFPVILGYVGKAYSELSGTAFSIVITLALIGNFICNYIMGVLAELFSLKLFPVLLIFLILLMFILLKVFENKLNNNNP